MWVISYGANSKYHPQGLANLWSSHHLRITGMALGESHMNPQITGLLMLLMLSIFCVNVIIYSYVVNDVNIVDVVIHIPTCCDNIIPTSLAC